MALADNIKRYRKLRGLSVQQLADKMEVGKQNIYNWESGDTEPTIDSLTSLSRALDVSIENLMDENPTSVDKTSDNNGKSDPSIDEAIRHLIDGNTEYILMHKVVILDKYRLVSIEDIEKADKELERKQEQITGLYEIIKTIAGKVPDPIPLPDPVTVKLPEVHKA